LNLKLLTRYWKGTMGVAREGARSLVRDMQKLRKSAPLDLNPPRRSVLWRADAQSQKTSSAARHFNL